ncbi:MAG: hypothetical protein IRZ28_21455 [Steroidobacteraceae bacterium]|nr:hypothetical protein [Steroidobacteraceae bacterium]
MKTTALVLALLLASLPAFATQGLDGKWTGSIDTPNGPVQLTYEFKSNGKTFTGSTVGPDGMPIPLENGKIDGNTISFSLTLNFGQPTTFNYTGVLAGEELTLHSEFMGQPFDFKLRKAN